MINQELGISLNDNDFRFIRMDNDESNDYDLIYRFHFQLKQYNVVIEVALYCKESIFISFLLPKDIKHTIKAIFLERFLYQKCCELKKALENNEKNYETYIHGIYFNPSNTLVHFLSKIKEIRKHRQYILSRNKTDSLEEEFHLWLQLKKGDIITFDDIRERFNVTCDIYGLVGRASKRGLLRYLERNGSNYKMEIL